MDALDKNQPSSPDRSQDGADDVGKPESRPGSRPGFPKAGMPGVVDGPERYSPAGDPPHAKAPPQEAVIRPEAASEGARFLSGSFSNKAGKRPYKLYVPSGYRRGAPLPLVVMLHGCTQSPDDFAAGTRMNEFAEQANILVAYPAQIRSANLQKCWNWFAEGDQHRDHGEPSLIAGITHTIMEQFSVDPRKVYVAGMSAGGAAAAIMGETYSDLFAAVGIHSGVPCGVAYNLPSAMVAMRGGQHLTARLRPAAPSVAHRTVPAIVFHGDRDHTVNIQNAGALAAQFAGVGPIDVRSEELHVPDGHHCTKLTSLDAQGRTIVEQWVVHGGGHAWSGGSPKGSYTDRHGPDATAEMLRFFLDHPHPDPAGIRAANT